MSKVFNPSLLPTAGIGVTYSGELHGMIIRESNLIDTIELEPQTFWLRDKAKKNSFLINEEIIKTIKALPQKKIIHSVGIPVGGNLPPDSNQLKLLKHNINYFESPWASEHLSFNSTLEFNTGFFLPPRQTDIGVSLAVRNINMMKEGLMVPFGVETGVNYLKKRPDEMDDGEFVNNVVTEADCGIILDLHNIYCNDLNGRQKISDFLNQIPLDRVIEVHLAGGIEMNGYWLDAHSGEIPQRLIDISREVIPHLKNLKVIIFEILSSYIPVVGENLIIDQLKTIKDIWNQRDHNMPPLISNPTVTSHQSFGKKPVSDTLEWENQLGNLAVGHSDKLNISFENLANDKGVQILNTLINEFRASMLVSVLKLSTRYIMLTVGVEVFKLFLEDFFNQYKPKQFGTDEALNFLEYLRKRDLQWTILDQLMNFEESLIYTLIDGEIRIVKFSHNPLPLLTALFEGILPGEDRLAGNYEIEITPDTPLSFMGDSDLVNSKMAVSH